jgi:hypothetical protein
VRSRCVQIRRNGEYAAPDEEALKLARAFCAVAAQDDELALIKFAAQHERMKRDEFIPFADAAAQLLRDALTEKYGASAPGTAMPELSQLSAGRLRALGELMCTYKQRPAKHRRRADAGRDTAKFTGATDPLKRLKVSFNLTEIIGVKFKRVGKVYYLTPRARFIKRRRGGRGDLPGRRAVRGVYRQPGRRGRRAGPAAAPGDPPATEEDLAIVKRNEERRRRAGHLREKNAAHGLDMHLVDAEYAFDGSKLLFYFTPRPGWILGSLSRIWRRFSACA